jgi:hypothetical protein
MEKIIRKGKARSLTPAREKLLNAAVEIESSPATRDAAISVPTLP